MEAEQNSQHKHQSHPACEYPGCQEVALAGKKICFWHDPESSKQNEDVRPQLEQMVREGKSLAGFRLARANLENIDLVCRRHSSGPDLSHADLYRANLRGAHLYKANMKQACLMKAHLSSANLNFAELSGANLLGVRLDYSRMEHVNWGKTLFQELEIKEKAKNKSAEEKRQMYGEAEEVCRNIRKSCEAHGLFDDAGRFFQKEMTFRRYQYPLGTWQRWTSKIVDLLCGYGERPFRVFVSSAGLVFACALFYFITGMVSGDEILRFEFNASLATNLRTFFDALYFSVVTFTTLGYGDLTPLGPARTMAALEAFIGNFALALFVVVFVKKMTR
ncbi:pentapeptide repeat-containing protein [Sansalvadorimonas sp. 2012CJ34-2]|uniref:Pentapeptide repeat-containing protein n=1 Tax=Parendozoicomonas callyspongiae TaxID=2942213 RepID=A0ABT0PJP3_9GAMM|nr:pentapeptide repeat-containing protein [Sansalvadorimonas sp. 2012CJ34-2]MCL6271609.1 pentapeptide repeat-containing protein [Sansalvadorimonas sp. 2012CJ34-2]